jgi:NAD(P)-dependent dehydrogenase (short-subunit alcohol dehydrogenase family)
MASRTWLITGVSSGFGRELTQQLLDRGDRVVGSVRNTGKVADLLERHPETFRAEVLDVTDTAAVHEVVDRSFAELGRIDVIISNAGYGLFGAAEELTDAQVEQIIATNLTGSIQLIRSALPHLRAQGGGRIIQISTYGGQVAFPGNSLYHASKWGIEGFVESVAQEVAPFGIGMTIVEPGGAHRVPLRQRPGRRPHGRLRRHPGARLPRHARPGQRARPRGPGPDGDAHHRERRPRAGPAADGAGLPGPGRHAGDPPEPRRRLRAPDRGGRVHRLPARRMRHFCWLDVLARRPA